MKNFIAISQDQKLSKNDFLEVIRTWESLFLDFAVNGWKNNKMTKGLLRVAASLYVIDELKNTPADFRIKKIAKLGKTENEKYLEQIYEIMREVEHIIID